VGVALRHILPLARENRWSDLLAILIERDPQTALPALGLDAGPALGVRREHGVTSKDRADLVLESDGDIVAVIEVKLLSGLGLTQLRRYRAAFPDARNHILISPERLRLDIAREVGWRPATWESVLDAFTRSSDQWVAETATDWLTHLNDSLPKVGPDSPWNGIAEGDDFVLAMRARSSWVFDHLSLPDGVDADLVQSSAGVSWVVRVFEQTPNPGFWILAEAEETLAVRSWPKTARADGPKPRGATVLVTLWQNKVRDSTTFDWDHLHRLWPRMAAHRQDWAPEAARPKSTHDKEAVARLRASGAPPLLGAGYGDAQARRSGACMFGARFRLPGDAQLSEVVSELERTADLVHELAQVPLR
jgi:hypothetical protein